ncbi:HTH-type transcriptional regulator PrtR [Pseudomonas syringae pv. actinidiae]|nr:HTH-type transcriptional regulator PrtR [Pseudomonas syringae pv. actinidiae]
MGGRIIVESVAGCSWNGWPDDRGIRKHGGILRVRYLYRLPNGGLRLRSHNDAEYPDEVFSGEDIARENIRILGWIFWWSTLNSRRNAMLLL